MITPELIRENPPTVNKTNKTEPLDWKAVYKRAARSNAWYKVDHAFTSPSAAASVALRVNKTKATKGIEAVARGVYVYVHNTIKK